MPSIIKTASRRNLSAPAPATNRPENAPTGTGWPYTLVDVAIFLFMSGALLFAMCATGRPGA